MLQINYTIIEKGIKGAADPRGGGQTMSNTGKENYIFYQFEKQAEQERQTNPGAFLLTEKESVLISKAAECINRVLAPYSKILEDILLKVDTMHVIVNDTITSFEDNKINIKKLRSIRQKYMSAYCWSIAPEIIKKEDKNGLIVTAATLNYKVTVSTEENTKDIILPDNHAFFKADTMQARAEALGLDNFCLYVSRYELNTLDTLKIIFSVYDAGATAETIQAAPEIESAFYSLVNSRVFTAPISVGENARKPKRTKEVNEKGRQISIAEYMTNNNLTISLTDFLPEPENLLSVGDPNTDKLLKQAQLIAMQTGQQEFDITINEFMQFRGLSDRKSAIDKAEKAAEMLDKTRFRIDEETEDFKAGINIHYVQTSGLVTRKGREGSVIHIEFSNKVFAHLMRLSQSGQQIAQYDKNIMQLPDNQRTTYNIAIELYNYLRLNAGRKTDHIIGIDTLLKYCSVLPLYPESAEDAGKEYYLRFKSEAPERIIKPFVKALDFMTASKQKNKNYQILERYTFKHKKGGALKDAELSEALKDYKKFTALNLEYKFINEPDYANLKERKAIQQEKAEKAAAKKKAKNKK